MAKRGDLSGAPALARSRALASAPAPVEHIAERDDAPVGFDTVAQRDGVGVRGARAKTQQSEQEERSDQQLSWLALSATALWFAAFRLLR